MNLRPEPRRTRCIQGQLLRVSERREAAIFLRDGSLWVADFKSSGGLMMNGEKKDRAVVKDGDVISICGSEILCRIPPGSCTAAARARIGLVRWADWLIALGQRWSGQSATLWPQPWPPRAA